jgi:hypothetical protein
MAKTAQYRKKTGPKLFKPGQSGNPTGRKKGVPNKLTRTAKENIQAVYGALGDTQGHVDFLQSHPLALADFYNNVYPRLLPLDINHGGSMPPVYLIQYSDEKQPDPTGAENII